jgi:hypothetical protein
VVLPEHHAIDVLDDEGFRHYAAQDAVEFAVKEISLVGFPLTLSALRVALTGITSDKKIGSRKLFEVANVAAFDLRRIYVFRVCVTCSLPNVVRPDDVVPEFLESVIRAPAAAKQRYCRPTCHALP